MANPSGESDTISPIQLVENILSERQVVMALATLPDPIAVIEEKLHRRFPEAKIAIDAPSNAKGSWFLEIGLQGHLVAIQWKADRGFGITTNPSNGGYGEGVHETIPDEKNAYKRITTLLLGRASTSPPESVRLRELRAIRGISQVELAEALNVQQAAISRVENRKDNILLSTLKSVVAAMGGELKVTAKFPDGVERQLQLEDEVDPSSKAAPSTPKSARRSHA
jgi:DNA-binding XRE family transcriptional regulator